MFANWNTPFWTPEMANLSCQCKKIKIRSWSFYRFYVVMEEKEEENNGGDIEELNSWMPLLQFVCWPEYYFEEIYIYYSTCCYESKCRLCASHLNLRMSSEKIFAKFAKYQKPSLPENIRQLHFVYHFFSSDLSFYRNYFHLFQQLFSFAIEGAVPKRNPQQYSIISIHQLL